MFRPVDEPRDVPLPVAEDNGSRFGKAHHILLIFAGLALLAWLLSGFYTVNVDEVAVVERLGQYLTTGGNGADPGKVLLVGSGLQYHLPWPIDDVHKVSIRQTRNLVVKIFNSTPDSYQDFKQQFIQTHPGINLVIAGAIFDPYLITGDKNIVHMEVAVQYTVDDPEAWLTTAWDQSDEPGEKQGMREAIFQQVIQHAMVHMASSMEINNVLFEGREKLPGILADAIQDALRLPDPRDPTGLKRINLGIHVEKVDLVQARPPLYVQPYFDLVTQARATMVSNVNQAESDRATMVTQATAQKATMKGNAEAYSKQVVEAARGEAARFKQVYEQYQRAPDVTRFNLWADAVNTVAKNAVRVIYAKPGQQTTLTIDPPQFDPLQVNTKQ